MAYTALLSLDLTIDSFLKPPYSSHLLPNPEIELIQQEVWSLEAFLEKEITNQQSNSELVDALEGQITDAIPKFKDVLESHVHKYHSLSELIMSFSQDLEKVKQEMDDFVETMKRVKEQYILEKDLRPRYLPLPRSISLRKHFCGTENTVGLNDELKKLQHRLVGGSAGLEIIPVVGMGGIGKTTLVKKVYSHRNISSYFDFRAFVTVGPEYHIRNILLDVLVHLYPSIDERQVTNDDQLVLDIYQGLVGKRYLIVFDELWNVHVWDKIKRAFPDNDVSKGRIILTTRLSEVALDFSNYREAHKVQILNKEFLNKEESWNLFCQKLFLEESCPPKLEKVGKKIVQLCEGLPLAIISVANFLSGREKTLEYWEEVAENENVLPIDAYDGPSLLSERLFLSFKHLPQHLKDCFLYVAVFPLNQEISVSKLVELWVAEGLIGPKPFKTFEDTAEEYLEDLVSKSVVLIRQRSSRGRIKTCSAHYFFWHLCVREAANKNNFHVINNYPSAFSKAMHCQRRLCIHRNVLLGLEDVCESLKSASNVGSFLCTGPHHQYPVSISLGLTSVKVLDALSVRFYEFPMVIPELILLKYLAFSFNGKLPPSISILQNLLYLIVHRYLNINSSGAPSYMPVDIWRMQKLRHLQVTGSDLPDPPAGAFLPNLLTLLDVSARSCTEVVLQSIPNLQKLGVRIVLEQGVSETLGLFDHLVLLPRLKSFKCVVSNPNLMSQNLLLPDSISTFPASLTKLALSGCGFYWKDMSLVGALPNLKVLKLRCYAFRGPEWEPDEEEFPKLEYLLLEDTDLVHWRVKDSCFTQLQRLVIKHCYKLEEIPFVLGDITTLEVIELADCSTSALASAKKIQEDQLDLGNELLQVRVYSSLEKVKA